MLFCLAVIASGFIGVIHHRCDKPRFTRETTLAIQQTRHQPAVDIRLRNTAHNLINPRMFSTGDLIQPRASSFPIRMVIRPADNLPAAGGFVALDHKIAPSQCTRPCRVLTDAGTVRVLVAPHPCLPPRYNNPSP